MFDQFSKQPFLSFVRLFADSFVLDKVNYFERIQITKQIARWLDHELSRKEQELLHCEEQMLCSLFCQIICRLIFLQTDNFCAIPAVIGDKSLSLSEWMGSSNRPPSINTSLVSSLSPFLQSLVTNSVTIPLMTQHSVNHLLVVFFRNLSFLQMTSLSKSTVDSNLFKRIFECLRMDLSPQIFHEMIQYCLFSVIPLSSDQEYSSLVAWLLSNSSKRKSTSVPFKAKRVRCEVSPMKEPEAIQVEDISPQLRKTPRKLLFGTTSPLRSPIPPLAHSSSKSNTSSSSRLENGIAFTSPDKGDTSGDLHSQLLSPLRFLKESLKKLSLSDYSASEQSIESLTNLVKLILLYLMKVHRLFLVNLLWSSWHFRLIRRVNGYLETVLSVRSFPTTSKHSSRC